MDDLLRSALDFIRAGGTTMPPLLICCVGMWYLILRVWLDLMPGGANARQRELASVFRRFRSGDEQRDEQLSASAARVIEDRARRRLSMASTLAKAAPLLGLLGTVTGMIETFEAVGTFGMVNPKALSAGISQAMISTQTGLVIAVPGLLTVYFLRRRAAHASTGLMDHARQLTARGACP